MVRRCWIVGTLALWAAASGCTGTAMRNGSPLAYRQKAWADAPAPPQRQVTLPSGGDESKLVAGSPAGLSKYFPGLRRNPAAAPGVVATAARPPRFGLARRTRPNQVYMTDARAGLNAGMAEASALPVALQMPTDHAVTPTNVEAPVAGSEPSKPEIPSDAKPLLPDVGSASATPHDEEPAAPTAVASRMPHVPSVDPLEGPPSPWASNPPAPSEPKVVRAGGPDRDADAVKAVPAPAGSATSATPSEPTLLAGFFRRKPSTARTAPHVHTTTVLASPQSPPPPVKPASQALPSPPVKPTPPAKPSPQVLPTSQVQPTPQGAGPAATCVAEKSGSQHCQHCCLRRMVGKLCGLIKPKTKPRATAPSAGH